VFTTNSQQALSYGHGGPTFGYSIKLEYSPDVDAIVSMTMTFNESDFVVVNWLDDFCYPVIAESGVCWSDAICGGREAWPKKRSA